MALTQNYLKELFEYNPDTGIFYRKVGRNQLSPSGSEAGTIQTRYGKSYRRIGIDGKYYLAHRLVWLYVNGVLPDQEIDHIDGNGLNNKIDNLRAVSHLENGKNRKMPSSNTSGHVGVYWNKRKQKWESKIRINGLLINVGTFCSKEDAIKARKSHVCFSVFHPNHGSVRSL